MKNADDLEMLGFNKSITTIFHKYESKAVEKLLNVGLVLHNIMSYDTYFYDVCYFTSYIIMISV